MFRDLLRRRRATTRPAGTLGPLEHRVLECLWSRASAATVRELQPAFPSTAYTTLMTTLDRLFRKGLLEREKVGRAFRYRPMLSRGQWLSEVARQSVARLLPAGGDGLRPVLSSLVETVSEQDAHALDELERLIQERRRLGSQGRSRP